MTFYNFPKYQIIHFHKTGYGQTSVIIYMSRVVRWLTAQLISSFLFTIDSMIPYFLDTKFQASSYLLWLYSPVSDGPGQKPRRQVFSHCGSNKPLLVKSVGSGYKWLLSAGCCLTAMTTSGGATVGFWFWRRQFL